MTATMRGCGVVAGVLCLLLVTAHAHAEPPRFVGVGGGALGGTAVVLPGETLTFGVAGGTGISTVSIEASSVGTEVAIEDLQDGFFRFEAPSTGAYAGTWRVLAVDEDEVEAELALEVRPEVVTEQRVVGALAPPTTVQVLGLVVGATPEIVLESGDARVEDIVVEVLPADDDEDAGNPAQVLLSVEGGEDWEDGFSFSLVVEAGPSGAVEQGDWEAVPSVTLRGRIFGPGSTPLPGARIRTQLARTVEGEVWEANADAEGRFTLRIGGPLLDGERLQVVAPGYLTRSSAADFCTGLSGCQVVLTVSDIFLRGTVEGLIEGETVRLSLFAEEPAFPDPVGFIEVVGTEDETVEWSLPTPERRMYPRLEIEGLGYLPQVLEGPDDAGFDLTDEELEEVAIVVVPTSPLIVDLTAAEADEVESIAWQAELQPTERAGSWTVVLEEDGLEIFRSSATAYDADEASLALDGVVDAGRCGADLVLRLLADNDAGLRGEDTVTVTMAACETQPDDVGVEPDADVREPDVTDDVADVGPDVDDASDVDEVEDTTVVPPRDRSDDGCGCAATPGSSGGLPVIAGFLLLLVVRRTRRTAQAAA